MWDHVPVCVSAFKPPLKLYYRLVEGPGKLAALKFPHDEMFSM